MNTSKKHVTLLASALLVVLFTHSCQSQFCTPPNAKATLPYGLLKPINESSGDYMYIGGLFDIHGDGETMHSCGKIRGRGVQSMEAFMWAVRSFRSRYPEVLSNVGLGGFAFDTCSNSQKTVQQILNLENCQLSFGNPTIFPRGVMAYVGIEGNDNALVTGKLLSDLTKTFITHAAKSHVISDTADYPYLLRTVPSDTDDVGAVIMVLRKMKWKYVQVVYTDDDDDQKNVFTSFEKAANENGICIVRVTRLHSGASVQDFDQAIMSILQSKSTRAVVIFADTDFTKKIIEAASQNSQTAGIFTWITRASLGVEETNDINLKLAASGGVVTSLDNTVNGGEDFKAYFMSLKPNNNTYNHWFSEYWESVFECNLPGIENKVVYPVECDVSKQNLNDRVSIDPYAPFVIKAVDAIVNGIEAAWRNKCPGSAKPCSRFNNDVKKWDFVFNEIKKIKINDLRFKDQINTGDTAQSLHFVNNYRQPDILSNCPKSFCFQRVGLRNVTDGKTTELLERLRIYDSSNQPIQNPESTCPVPCSHCPLSQNSTPAVTSTTPQTTVSLTEKTHTTTKNVLDVYESKTEAKPAPLKLRTGRWVFALIVLAGLGLFLVVVFEIYIMSKIIGAPIVKHWRTMWLGQLLLFAIFLCYLVLFAFIPSPTPVSCAITRFGVGVSYAMCFSILLVKLMIILSSKSVGYLKGVYQVLMFTFAWGVQIVVDAEWLILREPGAKLDNSTTGTEKWVCSETFSSHVQSLVYVMFLIVVTTILAMRTHGIITNHREGIFIGLCSGFSIPIWIVWILVGTLNPDKDYQDPCLAFGLFITATLILFIMFLPKVRQLNSMGVEGIYAEDDQVDYAGSVIQGSVIHGNLPPGSIVYSPPAYKSDALYLKYPSSAASVRSAPPVYANLPRKLDTVQHSTKVLRMTGDLTGRTAVEKGVQSELNYGTAHTSKYQVTGSKNGTLKRPRSLQDLGSL